MKKRARPAAKKKTGAKKRKPIMRHSREGVRGRMAKSKRGAKPKRAAKPRRAAKSKGAATPKRAVKSKRAAVPKRATVSERGAQPRGSTAARPERAAAKTTSKSRGPRPWESERGLTPRSGSRGTGSAAAGQSGDLEGLPRDVDVDSESVEELIEEGQAFEAGVVSGVEEADGETGEVHTHEVPVDDVPEEYLDED